jgi:MYXO-CTERM domain-containing protein
MPTGSGTNTGTLTVTTTGTTTATTATNTTSATGTRTAIATTNTVTATGTVTTTRTSVSPEPRTDAAPPITVADAATPDVIPDLAIRIDAVALRDGATLDATPGAVDTTVITPTTDAPGSMVSDGGVVLADATAGSGRDAGVAGREGGQPRTLDGAGGDGAVTTAKVSGGCGCVVGGGNTGPAGFWPLLILGFAVLWRGVRARRRRADRD